MKTVFIVDDSISKRNDIAATVRRIWPNASVLTTHYGKGLLKLLEGSLYSLQSSPDEHLIITDMGMPFTDGDQLDEHCGFTVLRWLERWELKCPAIVVSEERISNSAASIKYSHFAGSVLYNENCKQDALYQKILADYFYK